MVLSDVAATPAMRLDRSLVAHGLAATRSKARDLILRGVVQVDGRAETKPGAMVAPDVRLAVDAAEAHYVSRGGLKLAAALKHFEFSPDGVTAIDVGSSTGGFTDVLLRQGADHVYAVDVGHDQLHASLRGHDRVTVLEGTDARQLTRAIIPSAVTAIVCDVSFISLARTLPAAMVLAAPGAWLIALIKPQFELDPTVVGKGGIVKSEAARQAAVTRVSDWLDEMEGWRRAGVISSPITGKGGNAEFLIGARFDD